MIIIKFVIYFTSYEAQETRETNYEKDAAMKIFSRIELDFVRDCYYYIAAQRLVDFGQIAGLVRYRVSLGLERQ